MDEPELVAINAIFDVMKKFDRPAKNRIMEWIRAKFDDLEAKEIAKEMIEEAQERAKANSIRKK